MDKVDYFVDPDIRVAESLPALAFHSQEFLARELETIFRTSWQLVPPYGDATAQDAQLLFDHLLTLRSVVPFTQNDTPLFLAREKDWTLRLFPNTCTHAWYPLVREPHVLASDSLKCGQHGRQFAIDGSFQKHAKFAGAIDFPRECDNLKALPAATWWRFLFAALAEPAISLDATVAEMQRSVATLLSRDWKHVRLSNEISEIEGNWKLHAWNYMDKFHITFIHGGKGGLTDAVNLPTYRTELFERSALQWVYARYPEDGFAPDELPSRFTRLFDPTKRVYALWWFVFPNMTFNFYPWGLSINVYEPVRGNPDKTRFLWYHVVYDEAKYARRETSWQNQTVVLEDVAAIGATTQSVRSPFAPRGRFAPLVEAGPHWFHRLVYQSVFENTM